MEHGKQMGCSDSVPPENATETKLSRIYDALRACEDVGPEAKDAFWNSLPVSVRMDYVWANWHYLAKGQ